MTDRQSHTLPDDPALAEVAASLQGSGHWGWVVDPQWRILFVTDELRLTFGGNVGLANWPVGVHMFSPEFLAATREDLMERLDPGDAAALDLDPDRATYTTLGDLDSATEKARRDAPAIAVCEV